MEAEAGRAERRLAAIEERPRREMVNERLSSVGEPSVVSDEEPAESGELAWDLFLPA